MLHPSPHTPLPSRPLLTLNLSVLIARSAASSSSGLFLGRYRPPAALRSQARTHTYASLSVFFSHPTCTGPSAGHQSTIAQAGGWWRVARTRARCACVHHAVHACIMCCALPRSAQLLASGAQSRARIRHVPHASLLHTRARVGDAPLGPSEALWSP